MLLDGDGGNQHVPQYHVDEVLAINGVDARKVATFPFHSSCDVDFMCLQKLGGVHKCVSQLEWYGCTYSRLLYSPLDAGREFLAVTWKQQKSKCSDHEKHWRLRLNIICWSRPEVMFKLPKHEMVLSSCMLSSEHCGFLRKKGQNRMGLIGQIGRITKNIMHLLLLLEQGLSLEKNIPWVMNLEQASKNSQTTKEWCLRALGGNHMAQKGEDPGNIADDVRVDWNKASDECYTCLFEKSNDVDLEHNDRNNNDVEYSFMDERISVELREAPVGKGVLGIEGASKPEGIGTIIFQVTDDEGRASGIELENVL
eukprot:14949348-Ditylum_brightwellii.AAC.3